MINDIIEINLNGKKYKAKLDMGAIAKSQFNLKNLKENITVVEMFDLVQKQNYMVINNIFIESVRRCHKDLTFDDILDEMKLNERHNIISSVVSLINASLPKEDKKKE